MPGPDAARADLPHEQDPSAADHAGFTRRHRPQPLPGPHAPRPAMNTNRRITSTLRRSACRHDSRGPGHPPTRAQNHLIWNFAGAEFRLAERVPNGGSARLKQKRDRSQTVMTSRRSCDRIAGSARCPVQLNGVTGGMQITLTPARPRGQRGRARRRRRPGPGDHAAVNPGKLGQIGQGYDLARLLEQKLACGPRKWRTSYGCTTCGRGNRHSTAN